MPAMLLAGRGGVKQTVKGEVESWSGVRRGGGVTGGWGWGWGGGS